MYVISLLALVVAIMFYTMMERKILSYIQSRKGPKKVGYLGLLTPVLDGLKIALKSTPKPKNANPMKFPMFPVLIVFTFLAVVYVIPHGNKHNTLEYSVLVFLALKTLGGLFLIFVTTSTSKKYALLGGSRVSMNMLSHEVIMVLLMLVVVSSKYSYSFYDSWKSMYILTMMYPPLFMYWFISGLLELKRTPFDLAEGESELVSGVNIEYGGLGFVCFYLPEYGYMVVFSMVTFFLWL